MRRCRAAAATASAAAESGMAEPAPNTSSWKRPWKKENPGQCINPVHGTERRLTDILPDLVMNHRGSFSGLKGIVIWYGFSL